MGAVKMLLLLPLKSRFCAEYLRFLLNLVLALAMSEGGNEGLHERVREGVILLLLLKLQSF